MKLQLTKSFAVSVGLIGLMGALGCASQEKQATAVASSTSASASGGDPWFASVRNSDIAVMQGMIDAGKDVNSSSPNGTTALMAASRNGSVETAKWLLEKGADATLLDVTGQSALVYALVGNASPLKREQLAEMLLSAGANPFLYDKIGFQPLVEMIELEMNQVVMKLKFTSKKPCDLVETSPQRPSLARVARRAENIQLAEFFEKEGCW